MRSHEGEGPKQFKVGFRGYRRDTVDEYVERLHQWLLDSEARAEHAVETATAAVGDKASEILRAALTVGEQAEQEAEAVKAAAVENAQSEADRMMGDAHRQIQALQQSIDNLAVRRANVVSELGRLQQYLAAAAPDGTPREIDLDAELDAELEDDEPDEAMSAAPDVRPDSKNGDRSVARSA
jgi:cell division septum initiation protein DivIVA